MKRNSVSMKTEQFCPVHTVLTEAVLDGMPALRVTKGEEKRLRFDENTFVLARGVQFHNGVIEAEFVSRLLPDAPDFARGFIGIVFRAAEDGREFESFYIRPTNAHAEDPVRRAHGCQYFAYPGYTFAYFREFGISGYEAPVDTGLEELVHLRAEIRGEKAAFYLNHAPDPVLRVEKLLHGADAVGGVGLFVDIGTEGLFRSLTILSED